MRNRGLTAVSCSARIADMADTNLNLPRPPRRGHTCPHCWTGPMPTMQFDVHLRFECVALGRREAAS